MYRRRDKTKSQVSFYADELCRPGPGWPKFRTYSNFVVFRQ